MKRIIKIFVFIACLVLISATASFAVFAETGTEATTETVRIEEDVAGDIVDAVVSADSKSDAIIAVASKLGITVAEAEAIVDAIISAGDEHLGEYAWWTGFKEDIAKNRSFWVTVVLCIMSALAILGAIFVVAAKAIPAINKSNFGTNEMFKISSGMQEANSQTLAKIEEIFSNSAGRISELMVLLEEKEEYIKGLVEKMADLEIENENAKRNMVTALAYNLQILKLIISRTALPLADKAAVDLWFTRAMESLKGELSADDVQKLDNIARTLEANDGEAV